MSTRHQEEVDDVSDVDSIDMCKSDDEAELESEASASSASSGEVRGSQSRARSPETTFASMVSRALAGDLRRGAPDCSATVEDAAASVEGAEGTDAKEKDRNCCICGSAAIYTCPGCGRRTCCIACVRVHKSDHGCSGMRDVTRPISLKAYTDADVQRDFQFLEDCRRVVSNANRQLPPAHRFDFRALPPPLRALREAARRRGVVCQVMSDGMTKRELNTSRYDRSTNTVIWRCAFTFHRQSGKTFTITTNWGSERHRLGDILAYCWSTNPPLPCFHISQRYNREAEYIGAEPSGPARAAKATDDDDDKDGSPGPTGEREANDEDSGCAPEWPEVAGEHVVEAGGSDASSAPTSREDALTLPAEARGGEFVSVGGETEGTNEKEEEKEEEKGKLAEAVARSSGDGAGTSTAAVPLPTVHPCTPEEVRHEAMVREFLAVASGYEVLAKAERLGTAVKYFLLDPRKTLNENLRAVFFINEHPVFEVVHAHDLPRFPLVSDEDREAIRASFRVKERTPEELLRRAHPGVRLKADLDPEEVERLKGVPCRRHLQQRCVAGDRCPYWHCTLEEWPQCRSFEKTGRCPMGGRCSFRHGDRLPGEERSLGGGGGDRAGGKRFREHTCGAFGGRGRGRGGYGGRGGRGRRF